MEKVGITVDDAPFLAVELAIEMQTGWRLAWAAALFAVALVFVWRSFYKMRIESHKPATAEA